MADPVEVLDFWLGEVGPGGWFAVDDAIDEECRARFGDLWQAALGGGLDHWVDGTVGTLAYLILCDQLSRNMHRGNAQAYATDPQALRASRVAFQNNWDLGAPEPERQFFYLAFMHSEHADDQTLSVTLYQDRMPDTGANEVIHARAHAAIIARFGRFPGRNAALGRISTTAETEFLATGGYGELLRELRTSHAQGA